MYVLYPLIVDQSHLLPAPVLKVTSDTTGTNTGNITAMLVRHADLQDAMQPDVNHLSEFGASLLASFEMSGRLTDLEESITNLSKAVQLTKDGNPTKPVYLYRLSTSQRRCFKCLNELTDIKASISNL